MEKDYSWRDECVFPNMTIGYLEHDFHHIINKRGVSWKWLLSILTEIVEDKKELKFAELEHPYEQ